MVRGRAAGHVAHPTGCALSRKRRSMTRVTAGHGTYRSSSADGVPPEVLQELEADDVGPTRGRSRARPATGRPSRIASARPPRLEERDVDLGDYVPARTRASRRKARHFPVVTNSRPAGPQERAHAAQLGHGVDDMLEHLDGRDHVEARLLGRELRVLDERDPVLAQPRHAPPLLEAHGIVGGGGAQMAHEPAPYRIRSPATWRPARAR